MIKIRSKLSSCPQRSDRRLAHAEAAGGALTLDTEENEQKTDSRTEPLPAIRERKNGGSLVHRQ
jgi:hypothetical protein